MNKFINSTTLKNQYMKWIKDNIKINQINKFFEITTPFLDIYNDNIQIYIKITNSQEIVLSDDSYTIKNIKMSGINISNYNIKPLLKKILAQYDITLNNDCLLSKSSFETLPQKITSLAQAIIILENLSTF